MRFRPNIVLNDLKNPLCAEYLVGVRIKVGTAVLTGDVLVPRCSMTTHQQDGLPRAFPNAAQCAAGLEIWLFDPKSSKSAPIMGWRVNGLAIRRTGDHISLLQEDVSYAYT